MTLICDFKIYINFKFDQSLAILFTAVKTDKIFVFLTLNPDDSHGPAGLNLY